MRRNGLLTRAGLRRVPALWPLPIEEAFAQLVEESELVAVEVEGQPAPYYARPDDLDRARFRGRTTLLSPFDPLIYDRTRTEELFGFRYRLEIYVPPAKREFGYFVLPILHGDRLVGRIDPFFDRKAGVLRVQNAYAEPGAPDSAGPAMAKAIGELARWLGAREVEYGRVPEPWAASLD